MGLQHSACFLEACYASVEELVAGAIFNIPPLSHLTQMQSDEMLALGKSEETVASG